jgi:cell division protein FtsW
VERVSDFFRGDKIIWACILFLSIFSLLAVYSATGTIAHVKSGSYTFNFILKHGGILVLGWVLMYLTHLIDYRYYSRVAQIIFFISIPLLIYTMFAGTNLNSANRWISVPLINITFQTSDLAKLGIVMFLARILSKKQDQIKSFKDAFLPLLLPVIIITLLILPDNLSTALILFSTCLILLFIGRVNIWHLSALVGGAVVLLALFILLLFALPDKMLVKRMSTWKSRIESFTKSDKADDSYQVKQANIAIAKGGLVRLAPGNSVQRNYLPHPYSDFIFAIIIEEYGLLGGAVLMLIYLVLLYRCIKIVLDTPKAFGAFLAVGLGLSLTIQAMINMSVSRYIEENKSEEVSDPFIPEVVATA